MDSQEIPPMSPRLAGPTAPIPSRTSSKRALEAMPTNTLNTKRSDLTQRIKKRQKDLKPSSSYDSEYWSSHMEVLQMEKDLHEYNSIIAYREQTKDSDSNLSYNEWLRSTDMGLELSRKKSAIDLKLTVAESQAARLSRCHPLLQSWIKLFFGAASGFGLSSASYGPRDNSAQNKMRAEMIEKYHEPSSQDEMPDHIWEPVFGAWFRSDWLHAAYLYPSKSIEHMDVIFGEGAKNEIMTAANGLFLFPDIEKAIEQGYLAIVPDVRLDPNPNDDPAIDMHIRRAYVKDWEKTNPKEYKVIVLDNNKTLAQKLKPVFVSPGSNIKSIEDLDGRRLNFRTNFRPRARYMWWTYLNSVVSFSYRHKGTTGVGVDKEVELGNRYWGTKGRYVKKNQLLGFVEHMGQDIASIGSSSLLENALEGEGDDDKPDPSALVVIADSAIRQASTSLKDLGVEDESDDDESDSEGADEEEFE